ncbi:MAG TPA: hypothetical protein VMV69_17730 [Pirellulales bacterium]|nr:hypothetical protein [Pirellulales bacterium]
MQDEFTNDYRRRVHQFAGYLTLMESRTREVGGDCFIIFAERRHDGRGPTANLKAAKRQPVAVGVGGANQPGLFDDGADGPAGDEPAWRDDERHGRYVQFAYWSKKPFFVMDLPDSTLHVPEGRRVIRDLAGFFYVGERGDYPYYRHDVEEHNPLQKQYVFGDSASAAEDMAAIFFKVWNFPPDAVVYVTAASFFDKKRWEDDEPIS